MQREIIRVEPIDSNFEKWGAPVSTCTRAGNMVFVSGMPPFDPETGEILVHAPFERQVELILEQVKKALEAAGSDLDHVLHRRVSITDPPHVQLTRRSFLIASCASLSGMRPSQTCRC